MVVASHAERQGVHAKAKERVRGDVLAHVFCVKVLIGLATVPRIMVAKASVSFRLAREPSVPHSFFDMQTWKAMSMTGSQAQEHSQFLFRFCSMLPVLTLTESSFSIMEPHCPWEVLIFYRQFKRSALMRVSA